MAPAPSEYAPTAELQTTSIARIERAQLCDLFDQVGPDHPTLCDGWSTHHLAAHLKLREGTPSESWHNVVPGQGGKPCPAAVRDQSCADLVARLGQGPPTFSAFRLPKADGLMNTLEFLIHHEDVRRAAPTWEPRSLPGWVEDSLWSQV